MSGAFRYSTKSIVVYKVPSPRNVAALFFLIFFYLNNAFPLILHNNQFPLPPLLLSPPLSNLSPSTSTPSPFPFRKGSPPMGLQKAWYFN